MRGIERDALVVELADGRSLGANGPELDEDLSSEGLLRGTPAAHFLLL